MDILNYIINSKNEFGFILFTWQTLVGSLLGAVSPLVIILLFEKYKHRQETREYIYYLHRIVVDQINSLIEIRTTIERFLASAIKAVIENVDKNPDYAYSVDGISFPLFSVRSIPDDVNIKSSGSGYVDNKVARIYALSKDLPHIMDDTRLQLKDTLELNAKIVFDKINAPDVQKDQYKKI